MFSRLTELFSRITHDLRGRGRLREKELDGVLRHVRIALLEADVALATVKFFIEQVRVRALGHEVRESLTPGQAAIKIVKNELLCLMGDRPVGLDLQFPGPIVILLVGLQGSGKTTSAVKLARWLRDTQQKSCLLASTDVHRPAALTQLALLAQQEKLACVNAEQCRDPLELAERALSQARRDMVDVLIMDSAGRLHIDETMMHEITTLHTLLAAKHTLFVLDAMMGQDALKTITAFDEALPLSGMILTKADSDARGGAALSARHVTGKPILFMGHGEKCDDWSVFDPDRITNRILGMGDVLGLIQEIEQKTDAQHAARLAKKTRRGGSFSLEDFATQLRQMRRMGGLQNLLERLPLPAGMAKPGVQIHDREQEITGWLASIDSMTPAERRDATLFNAARKRRIALGSGTSIPAVNRLLKQFLLMQKMMKKMTRTGSLQQLKKQLQRQGSGNPPF